MTTVPATVQERIPQPAVGGPREERATGVSVGDVVGALRRRIVMITLLWLLFATMAVGLFFVVYIYFPSYLGEAWIECESNRPDESGQLSPEPLRQDQHERLINSQAQLVRIPEILNKVLKSPEVIGTNWYKQIETGEHFLRLEEDLISAPIRDSNYIRVALNCRKREDPAVIVNKVVTTYLSEVQGMAKDEFREQLSTYQDESDGLETRIQDKVDQIEEFTDKLPPGALVHGEGGRGGIQYEEMSLYAEQVAALGLQTAELEDLKEIYQDSAGPGFTTQDWQLVEARPEVANLVNQQLFIEQEMNVLKAKFGDSHREVRSLAARLEVVRDQLAQKRAEQFDRMLKLRHEQVQTAHLNSQHALYLAETELTEAKATQADLDRKLAEYQTLHDELELLKDQRARTNDFILEIDRVVREQQTIRVQLARRASPPLERSAPGMIWLPVGVLLAFMASVGLAMLVEFTDTSVRTPQDIVRHLNLPLLGVVPDVDDEEVEIERVETAVRDAPHSMVVEAFRTIRTNLQFSAPAERQRTIVITSPRPEDGKTAIASNLAAALAQGGRRVLLVDANFRRPALQNIYSGSGGKGLSNLLIGDGDLESLVCRTDIPNLDVLFSGPIPPNPAERLGSPQVREFLDTAVQRYDQIILDTSPVLLASDAIVLSTHVDGAIVVCRAKQNSRGLTQRCCSLLNRVNAHLFGAVLNAAQVRRGGYFREQIATFYDYQSEEALARGAQPALPPESKTDSKDKDTDESKDA